MLQRLGCESQKFSQELVISAAKGDIRHVRLTLEKEKFKIDLQAEDNAVEDEVLFTFATALETCPPATTREKSLVSFTNNVNTALQVAAQNGHINVCRMLINHYDASIVYQVQYGLFVGDLILIRNALF